MVAATLSDSAEFHARLHDLAVVAQRTRGRQRVLLASVPTSAQWAGPAAIAYTAHRLTARAAALGALADALDAVAGHLTAVVVAVAPLQSSRVDAASSPASIRGTQRLLAKAGASPGPADGTWGNATTAAVARVQRGAGLPASGAMDAATALALSAAAAGGAVAIGGAPGVPHGLQPLAGSHPVVMAAPPAALASPTATPTADSAPTDPSADPTSGDDPTSTADPTSDPSSSADPASDPSSSDGPTSPVDPPSPGDPGGGGGTDGGGAYSGPDTEGDDPGPSETPALRQFLHQFGERPPPVLFP